PPSTKNAPPDFARHFRATGAEVNLAPVRQRRIDIDQLAIVLVPLNFGNIGMRWSTHCGNDPVFWPLTFTADTLPVPRMTKSTLISPAPECIRQGTRPRKCFDITSSMT